MLKRKRPLQNKGSRLGSPGKSKAKTRKPRKQKRKSSKPKRGDPNSKYQKGRAKANWGKLVRLNDGNTCQFCGRSGYQDTGSPWVMNAHHVILASLSKFYKHDPANGLCLCFYCHKYDKRWSPHVNLSGYEAKLKKARPDKYKWWLKHKGETHPSIKITHKQIADDLQAILDGREATQ